MGGSISAAYKNEKLEPEMRCRSRSVVFCLRNDEKEILQTHWIQTVLVQEPRIFLKAMVASIKESPKLLDIISRKMRDPTLENIEEWPKLVHMAKGNCTFFTKQIIRNNLVEALLRADSKRLGSIHIKYSPYGFKTTFLDIWQSNIIKLIDRLHFPSQLDRLLFLKAFKNLSSFLCTLMVIEYEVAMEAVRYKERENKMKIADVNV